MKIYILIDARDKTNRNVGVFTDMAECEEARKRWAKQLKIDEKFLKVEEHTVEFIDTDEKCKNKKKSR